MSRFILSMEALSKKIGIYLHTNRSTLIKLSGLIVLGLLLHFNYFAFVSEWIKMDLLHEGNQAYLGHVRMMAVTDTFYLTELLAAAEKARSSEVDVSFLASLNVDIGNILHSFSQLLEKGIDVQLVSLVAIEMLVLIDSLAHWVSPFLFKVMIFVTALYYLAKLIWLPENVVANLHRLGYLIVGAFLFVHVALPYSIHLSSVISHELTHFKKQETALTLKGIHNEFTSKVKSGDVKENIKGSLSQLKSMSKKDITHKVSEVFKYVFTSIALSMFDLLIMPGMLLFLMYKVCIRVVSMSPFSSASKNAL